jgi:hypothetical protein
MTYTYRSNQELSERIVRKRGASKVIILTWKGIMPMLLESKIAVFFKTVILNCVHHLSSLKLLRLRDWNEKGRKENILFWAHQ